MELNSEMKKGISKKSGEEYILVRIRLTEDYEKVVFLTDVEKALVKVTYKEI